jgi:hypothetical protein
MKDNISTHITYDEATISTKAKELKISNDPNSKQLSNMKLLAENIFEKIRENFNVPIFISSFFRSAKLNTKLKGSSTSQHCANVGAAMDVDADVYKGVTNSEIFNYILDNLNFDQLIWEFGNDENPDWVHVSYVSDSLNRKEVLKASKDKNNKTVYTKI